MNPDFSTKQNILKSARCAFCIVRNNQEGDRTYAPYLNDEIFQGTAQADEQGVIIRIDDCKPSGIIRMNKDRIVSKKVVYFIDNLV